MLSYSCIGKEVSMLMFSAVSYCHAFYARHSFGDIDSHYDAPPPPPVFSLRLFPPFT